MLRDRLLTAAVALPALLLLFLYAPYWGFALFVAAIALIGVGEHAMMAFPDSPRERTATIFSGAVIVSAVTSGSAELTLAAIMLLVLLWFIWLLFVVEEPKQGFRDFGVMLTGVLYVGLFLPHFTLLHATQPNGRLLALFVVAVGMAGDTAGYFTGRRFGKNKLIPRVSPGKTVEGSVGIVVGCVAVASLAKVTVLPDLGWVEVVLLAIAMAVLGQIGDLSESIMKRTFGTKESGSIFPGHGGVLDRIDSLVFPVVLLYYYITLLS